MAAYTRGSNANIIVGAAALFVTTDTAASLSASNIPAFVQGESYRETLALRNTAATGSATVAAFRNVGYTNNGIEISFQPDFGEVMVDQLLDTAKIFKQGMKVTLKTTFAEATLENLLLAIAGKTADYGSFNILTAVTETQALANLGTLGTIAGTTTTTTLYTQTVADRWLNINSGDLGDYPVERGIIAVGPGVYNKDGIDFGSPSVNDQAERVYIAYRAVSMDQVTVAAKRDAATAFDVTFRLLPDDSGSYGKIVDRTY
jgi:hypothetical protein